MRRRLLRINDLLRDEISDLLTRNVRDPRLGAVISITEVETAPDLQRAKVHVSVLGSDTEKAEALAGLRSATGYLRHELRDRLDLRYVPELSFHLDQSIERGTRVLNILQEVAPESGEEQGTRNEEEGTEPAR